MTPTSLAPLPTISIPSPPALITMKSPLRSITLNGAPARCNFETKFSSVYQRNNKARSKGKEGMKNIRCFPNHGKAGHVEKGFCGSTVSFTVQTKECDAPLKAWAQFELADGSNRVCVPGDLMRSQEITENLERTRFALAKPWFPTIQSRIDVDSTRFIINSERWGWNYSWVSNVHTCDLTHRLFVYLFEVVDQDTLRCIEILPSTEFQVFCSRRRRTPTSPSSVTVSSPMSTSSTSSPLTVADDESNDGSEPEAKRCRISQGCSGMWREASNELAAASLLLLVRTGSGSPS